MSEQEIKQVVASYNSFRKVAVKIINFLEKMSVDQEHITEFYFTTDGMAEISWEEHWPYSDIEFHCTKIPIEWLLIDDDEKLIETIKSFMEEKTVDNLPFKERALEEKTQELLFLKREISNLKEEIRQAKAVVGRDSF